MKKNWLTLPLLLVGISTTTLAQKTAIVTDSSIVENGHLEVLMADSVQAKINQWVAANTKEKMAEGFRIKFMYYTRDEARRAKSHFLKAYPEIDADVAYAKPHFLLFIGNFRNELAAEKMLEEFKTAFPGGMAIKTNVDYTLLAP